MPLILETERLLLREFNTTDAPFILNLMNTPGWLEFIGDRQIKTVADAEKYLVNGPLKSYEINGFGLWLVEMKDGKLPIGMCGLINREGLSDIDIGFALLPEYEKKGYAFEIAKATFDFARNNLQLNRVAAITTEANSNSINLLKKLGMKFQEKITLPPSTEELLLFSIDFN